MALGPILSRLLDRYGLGSLKDWASTQLVDNVSEEEFLLALYDRPEFKTRFWMIGERERKGLSPVSAEMVLAYEAQVAQMAKAFGVTVTQRQAGEMMANDISAAEVEDRIGIAAAAVYQSPPETRAALNRLYGITAGDLVNYWLDPKKTAPILQRRFTSAQIAAEAERVGFATQLTGTQAESLFEAGLGVEAARQGFGQLVEAEQLFEAVDVTEEDLDIDTQLQLLTGNVDVAEQVGRRGERRAARFQEGGGFATGKTGVAGLGSASK